MPRVAKDHEGVAYLGEPIIFIAVPLTGAPFPGIIVVGEPKPGVVTPEHGALLEGMLYRTLMVRAGLL